MITLKRIIPELEKLGVSVQHIDLAIAELRGLQAELECVEVKGRKNVDALLGCMLAIDAVIGEENGKQTN